jgi:hypothetical protein
MSTHRTIEPLMLRQAQHEGLLQSPTQHQQTKPSFADLIGESMARSSPLLSGLIPACLSETVDGHRLRQISGAEDSDPFLPTAGSIGLPDQVRE